VVRSLGSINPFIPPCLCPGTHTHTKHKSTKTEESHK